MKFKQHVTSRLCYFEMFSKTPLLWINSVYNMVNYKYLKKIQYLQFRWMEIYYLKTVWLWNNTCLCYGAYRASKFYCLFFFFNLSIEIDNFEENIWYYENKILISIICIFRPCKSKDLINNYNNITFHLQVWLPQLVRSICDSFVYSFAQSGRWFSWWPRFVRSERRIVCDRCNKNCFCKKLQV